MVMKIDINELGPVQRKVSVELPPEMVASEISRAYKTLGQRVRVKGFRAGKIPRKVLEGIYGDEIKGQVKSHLVEESLGEVIKERGLQIVSRPEVEANDLEEGRPFSFSAVFEIKPEIDVKDYLAVELQKVKLSITDAQVEAALDRFREGHARLELVEGRRDVKRGDFVTLDFDGSVAGKPFAGGKGENYVLEVGGGRALPQFEDAVAGLKLGERRTVQVKYPDDYPNGEIAGKTVDFSVVVREIKQKVLPDLDDDLAKDHGDCASLEELRGKIRARLEDELKHVQSEALKEQLVSRLVDKHPFTPPGSMVERQTRYLVERYQEQASRQGLADSSAAPSLEETRKSLETRAVRQVRSTLLIERIAQLEQIEVTEQEVRERIDQLVRVAGERGKMVRDLYTRADARDDLRGQLVFDRTVSYLLERAKVFEVDPPPPKVDEQGEKS
jgi:trigger factor